jgi:hypothetical protein
MQLININKARYRRHLKIIIAMCAGGLAIGSLGFSQLLIVFFPDESGSHFHWNLLGVIVTSVIVAWSLNKYRHHDFMTEVVYVWELKQTLNKINRKMMKLKVAGDAGNPSALLAMHYCYEGSSLLWQLDDNTLLMDELITKQAELQCLAKTFNLVLSSDKYKEQDLKQF